jgi:hypothetical protein
MFLAEISQEFKKQSLDISAYVVQQLMDKHKLGHRTMPKVLRQEEVANRIEQFENIKKLRLEYEKNNNPIISFDTKKKEKIVNFARPGASYGEEYIKVLDHDFNTLGSGIVFPHGIFDTKFNLGLYDIRK